MKKHIKKVAVLFPLIAFVFLVERCQAAKPIIHYTVTIDSANLSGFRVDMKIHDAPDTLWLAFAQHPEYNEFFWKNLRDLTVECDGEIVPIVREDSALWRAVVRKPDVVVHYRFEMTKETSPRRGSWRLFLRETGGLIGGVQTFLYIVGCEDARSTVTLVIPASWRAATGLSSEGSLNAYSASNVDQLVDSPILLGKFHEWTFFVDDIPHHAVYLPLHGTVPFDTSVFVDDIEKIVRAAMAIFKRAPYREYWFLIQDGADDALEHLNSLSLGAESSQLANNPHAFDEEIAHEFFHTWNLVSIRPKEQTKITYKETTPTPVLWWSEGVTIYYANKILRQTGILDTAEYVRSFENNIASYYQSAGNSRMSPEHASLTVNHPDPADSGYTASYYTQGMLFGQLLDIALRDSSHMRRGLDDVMKAMFEKYTRSVGFTNKDLEETSSQVCGCDLHQFFQDHIWGIHPLNLEPYLNSIGLRAVINRVVAKDSAGKPQPDLRVYAFTQLHDGHVRIYIYGVPTAWWRAGLRTGDDILAVDGQQIGSADQFREIIAGKTLGDSLVIQYLRDAKPEQTTVHLTSYELVKVDLDEIPNPTLRQQEMLKLWIAGTL
ncbi:MAG TPA: PDZ domain-containing protein [Candidatus Kryptonia bacterium]